MFPVLNCAATPMVRPQRGAKRAARMCIAMHSAPLRITLKTLSAGDLHVHDQAQCGGASLSEHTDNSEAVKCGHLGSAIHRVGASK